MESKSGPSSSQSEYFWSIMDQLPDFELSHLAVKIILCMNPEHPLPELTQEDLEELIRVDFTRRPG